MAFLAGGRTRMLTDDVAIVFHRVEVTFFRFVAGHTSYASHRMEAFFPLSHQTRIVEGVAFRESGWWFGFREWRKRMGGS